MPSSARAKLKEDGSHWLLFVYHFLRHLPQSATLPILEETWWVLARRSQHRVEISSVMGDEAFEKWDKSFKQEIPVPGFIPFLIDLNQNGWITVERDTWKISLPANSPLLKNQPDKWRDYDVALALKVVAHRATRQVLDLASSTAHAAPELELTRAFEKQFAVA
jgi:hypothetical protein